MSQFVESNPALKIPVIPSHPAYRGASYETAAASFVRLPPEGEGAEDGASLHRLISFRFHSALLPEPEERGVCVYLPPQYAREPARRFPVFYLHDGQNLFDGRLSYIPGRTWRAGMTADETNESGLTEPVILVGIANTGLRRMAEYTPTRDFRMGGGDGSRYGRALIEEIKPFIDREFRTLTSARHTGLGGSSLGGLITLYLGLQCPNVFSRLAVLSPSIWWDHRSILNLVADAKPKPELKIWVDIGTAEGARHVRDAELLVRLLERQGWRLGADLAFLKVVGGVHDEEAWAARFGRVLTFLFPAAHDHGPGGE